MKWVRLENNAVREIIPEAATVPDVAHWYGEAFAAQCVEAPDEVGQRWIYDGENFVEPAEPDTESEETETEDASLQDRLAAAEDAACALDTVYDERVAAVEDALCELDAANNT